jgi:nucleotide-binding universal stress UspA family protein
MRRNVIRGYTQMLNNQSRMHMDLTRVGLHSQAVERRITMSSKRTIVVATEDTATAGVVGAAAAHVAMEEDATAIILLHVVENHVVAHGLMNIALPAPMEETKDEARSVLAGAEAALRAEYAALDRPVPSITQRLLGGTATGTVIAEVADDAEAMKIVVGGRRPHALGRFAHADVHAWLGRHTKIPVHVAPLQAEERQPAGGEPR